MIFESYPWKQDLHRFAEDINKFNCAELLSKDDGEAYIAIEKAVFYSAFVIRKLIECKEKVSDDIDSYKIKVKGIVPTKHMNFKNRIPSEETHDWNKVSTYTKSGKDICNWLIHSYVFIFCCKDDSTYGSFLVSSDLDKDKCLYEVQLDDWVNFMDYVYTDDIVEMIIHFSDGQYKFIKKKRG